MAGGRTTWWTRDAATHDRELVVDLGVRFGPVGPYILTVLCDLAQQQRDEGQVKTGWTSLARKVFCEPAIVREVVEAAVDIGALDDLQLTDERRFTVRVSGWDADTLRGAEAVKKAAQRAAAREAAALSPPEGTCPVSSPDVPLPDQTITYQTNKNTPRAEPAEDRVPDDVPDHLVSVVELVAGHLATVAEAKAVKKPVTLAAAGRIVRDFPDHDHGRIVVEFAAWWLDGGGQTKRMRDVAMTYRRRLSDLGAVPAGVAPLPRTAGQSPALAQILANAEEIKRREGLAA